MATRFRDRRDAGRVLARHLRGRVPDGALVLALPRGGVPVGYEVARALGAPLDVFVVRKLGTPGQEELAMGAVASGGVTVLSDEIIAALAIPEATIEAAIARERREIERREVEYRGGRAPVELAARAVILVDDGLATGATMRAAVRAVREARAAHVTVAVPVAAAETLESLADEADACIAVATPSPFVAVGLWYQDFAQTSDEEVRELLAAAAAGFAATEATP